MKENKKAILEILKKKSKKDGKFENLVLNLALQKIDSDNFEFDGGAGYTDDKGAPSTPPTRSAWFTT